MGYGAVSPDKNVRDLVDNLFLVANNIVRPRFYFRMFDGYVNKDCICCNQKIFHVNQTIATLLKNSERFVFFAATAGMEYQDFHNKLSNADDALLLFIWDTLGSCIAEATGDIMEKFVETELLFSLLPDNVCGITLNSSALMYPIKSISGVIGSGLYVDTRKYGCQFCELDNCYKKRIKKSFNHETQSQSE